MSQHPKSLGLIACLTAAAVAVAGPVSALSCLAPDPVAAFSSAAAAEEVYVVVIGTFSGGPGTRPENLPDGSPRTYLATFEGNTLNRDGPFEAISRSVIVEETCAASWCGQMEMGREVLTFLRIQEYGPPIAQVGPCYGNVFFDPTPEQREAIKSCFANGCTES